MNLKKYSLIAIDIAKETLQVQTAKDSYSVGNNEPGLKKLLQHIARMEAPFVVCEATGGYERALLELLHGSSIAVSRVNPARVRAFATSEGIKAKTDSIDARVLLRFAQHKELRPTLPPKPCEEAMSALLDRRSHLTEQLAREKNRLQNSPLSIHRSIERMLRFGQQELARIEGQIREVIKENEPLRAKTQILATVKGVGEVTTWTLLAYLGEMTHVSRNQLVALAGLAPYNRDSGKSRSKRSIQGGRAKVRKCLYMAARTAARHNPVIKAYVEGLIARGKPYKCALVAAMRKLLIHLQSLLKKHQLTLAS